MKFPALLLIVPGLCLGQSPAHRAAFEAVEVDTASAYARKVASPVINADRYEFRQPNMVDLISTAYSIASEKVLEGPLWVEYDRYNIFARIPPNTPPEKTKEMLQTVLETRFGLVSRLETRQMPAIALVSGKKLQLKPTAGQPSGCKMSTSGDSAETATFHADCHNMTMAVFADQVRNFPGGRLLSPVTVQETDGVRVLTGETIQDKTGIKGAWDFTLNLPLATSAAPGALSGAIESQLGLKLEPAQAGFPVLVIEKVNRVPTPNSESDLRSLAMRPLEFEVAQIKPVAVAPGAMRMMGGLRFPPGGRGGQVTISGMTLGALIQQAWDLPADKVVGGPKWLDNDRWEIVAKLPSNPKTGGLAVTAPEAVWPMVRALLADRFKLTTHFDEREVTAYRLVAVKPKFSPAAPGARTKCWDWLNPDSKTLKANPALTRLVTCRNVTMDEYALKMESFSWGYFADPIVNATNLRGTWDLTLNFSPWSMIEGNGPPGSFVNGVRVGGGMRRPGEGTNEASTPGGALSIFDALEKQLGLKLEPMKRKVQVLVIDHIEQKPTEN